MTPLETDDADNSAHVTGQSYTLFIGNLLTTLKPTTYFEIGTLTGGTLRLAQCASIAVDPQFRITTDVLGSKPSCMFFQEPSDAFFRNRSPIQLFSREIDLAFLDGMHLFEFLLRDFINTEKHCRPNSVIVLHDCLPPGFYMTVRSPNDPLRAKSRFKDWWTGDVWKILPVLKKYRPDLSITVTDCIPTGLVLITGLDPHSTTLERAYGEIIRERSSAVIDRSEYDAYWQDQTIVPAANLTTFDQLTARFWL
jgi:hypothetical protein